MTLKSHRSKLVSQLAAGSALLISLLLAITLAAMASAAQAAPPQAIPQVQEGGDEGGIEFGDQVVFTNAGFSFSLPAGWQMIDTDVEEQSGLALVVPDDASAESHLLVIGIGPGDELDPEAETLEEMAEAALVEFGSEEMNFSEPRPIQVNELEALSYSIDGVTDEGIDMAGRFVIGLFEDNRVFILFAAGPVEAWDGALVEAVLGTVYFSRPGPPAEGGEPQIIAAETRLGEPITETAGEVSLTVAPPPGWQATTADAPFDSQIDITMAPAEAEAGEEAPAIRIVLDLDPTWFLARPDSLEALADGVILFRETIGDDRGDILYHFDPEPAEVDGVEAARLDWDRSDEADAYALGTLVVAMPGEALFLFEAGAPEALWDADLARAVLDSIRLEGLTANRRVAFDQAGLSFLPPAGWEVTPHTNEDTVGAELLLPGVDPNVYGAALSLLPLANLGLEGETLADVAAELAADLAAQEGMEASNEAITDLSGVEAIVYDVTGATPSGQSVAGRLAVSLLEDERVLIVIMGLPPEQWSDDVFNALLGSIQLTEPGTAP